MNKYENLNIIGADETGVGDYLTPFVAAACYVPYQNVKELISYGITDSKKLTDKQMKQLLPIIKELTESSVYGLSQEGYNKINKFSNAHEIKTLGHVKCITSLEKRLADKKIDLVIIDQFASEKNWNKYVQKWEDSSFEMDQIQSKTKFVTKGEMEHVSVAAASILARNKLLSMMEEQEKKWKMKFLLGASHKVDKNAKEFIVAHGIENLPKVAKIKFANTKKL